MRVLTVHGPRERSESLSPVLLLHGSPSAPEGFDSLARALAARHRVVIGALPGYCGVPPLVPFSLDALHAGIERTLAEQSSEPWTLLGFSMGSYHALTLAVRRRIPIRRLVTLGVFPGLSDELRPTYREVALAIRSRALPPETFPPRMLCEAFLKANPSAREAVLKWLDVTTLDVLADELDAIADAPNLLPSLASLELPLLVRVGELDVATPLAWSQAVAAVAPHARLEIVPGAGHALLVEDARATEESVLRFVAAA